MFTNTTTSSLSKRNSWDVVRGSHPLSKPPGLHSSTHHHAATQGAMRNNAEKMEDAFGDWGKSHSPAIWCATPQSHRRPAESARRAEGNRDGVEEARFPKSTTYTCPLECMWVGAFCRGIEVNVRGHEQNTRQNNCEVGLRNPQTPLSYMKLVDQTVHDALTDKEGHQSLSAPQE